MLGSTVFCVLLAALAEGTPREAAEMRAEAHRVLMEWKSGRLSEAHERFTARLQQLVTPTQLEAALEPVRKELGPYASLESERYSDERIDGQRAVILDATVRFERGRTSGKFAFLAERGAWRLRYVKLELPLAERPPLDDAPVDTIAHEILAGLARDGLVSVVKLLPAQAKEQFGEQAVREVFEHMAETLGTLRSHTLGKPTVVGGECRQLEGRGRFEHGQAALRLALCPDQGAWRLLALDVAPEMTPLLFGRMASATLAQTLKRADFELACPSKLVDVGQEATCRFTSRGETRSARVRRVEDATLEVTID
jgi:hypothetical protein